MDLRPLALTAALMCASAPGLASEPVRFESSPGGVPEVDAAWVRRHLGAAGARIVDVREAEELQAEGWIEGIEAVPLASLEEAALGWSPREPVVLVCRSGRRSARGVQLLERMGFDRVASMTGGMLAWRLEGLPLIRASNSRARPKPVRHRALSATSLEEALRAAPPRRIRAAALLLAGTEACVDGREDHAVLGTPGGDAGELLLALATVEDVIRRPLSEPEVRALFEAYLSSFGRFYMHTDDHALAHLRTELRGDPRFTDAPLGEDADSMAEYLHHPPPSVRGALLEHVFRPDNVGCGHLRLVLTHPEEYGVRAALTHSLGRIVYERLWREPEAIDFVVLHGEHHEEAVVNVSLGAPVHAFTNVPALPPVVAGHSVFVNHPEVAAFVRREHAKFLFEELPALASDASLPGFVRALERKAQIQLERTVGYLARGLPVFELRFEGDAARVEPAAAKDPDCLGTDGCAECAGCARGSSRERREWAKPSADSAPVRSSPSPPRRSTASPRTR